MQRNALLAIAALAASLISMHLGTATAIGGVQSFRSVSEERGVVTFKLRGVDGRSIRSARVSGPRRKALRVRLRTVRRAARRGVLRVRVPRAWLRPSSRPRRPPTRAARHGRGRHRLRILTGGTAPPTTTGDKATTRPVGSATLSDAEAAARVGSRPENRSQNGSYNQRRPTDSELSRARTELRDDYFFPEASIAALTGNHSGSTDEVIQWAAHKWGVDEDTMRAVATLESWWNRNFINDYDGNPAGPTYGLFQPGSPGNPTVKTLLGASTAYNADYYGALIRFYFDGRASWLADRGYTAGDLWGSIGAHYSGGWYDSGANEYIAKVKDHLAKRTWAQAGF